MSGTSLDGLDIAYCKFVVDKDWSFEILHFNTLNYDSVFREKLRQAPFQKESDIKKLSYEFGCLMANELKQFVNRYAITEIDAVSTHGHTVFHQPDKGITLQIGDPKPIYDVIQKPVIYDFRSQDVALGGQGAPLVPLVDKLLFADYDACLNLGGFSNISVKSNNNIIAYDICPVNIVLNKYSRSIGFEFDMEGQISKSGNINKHLLKELNEISYYHLTHPKSLGLEWVENKIFPLIDSFKISTKDILRTYVEHIAVQISNNLKGDNLKILISGGGSKNKFLMERIKQLSKKNLGIISENITDYKEALIFGFLGVLRIRKENNCLKSVTGADKDHSSGVIFE